MKIYCRNRARTGDPPPMREIKSTIFTTIIGLAYTRGLGYSMGADMALARCKDCGHPKKETAKHTYNISVKPVGYPDNTAAVCGRPNCENPPLIWLNEEERKKYEGGQTIFGIHTQTMKVRVIAKKGN